MEPWEYFYIFEDGRVGQSESPPTNVDAECVLDGMLTVLRFGDRGRMETYTGKELTAMTWTLTEQCFVAGDEGVEYHTPGE